MAERRKMWTHGHGVRVVNQAALAPDPNNNFMLGALRPDSGVFVQIPYSFPTNMFLFAIPSEYPAEILKQVGGGRLVTLARQVTILYSTDSARITAVALWDGSRLIWRQAGINASGDHSGAIDHDNTWPIKLDAEVDGAVNHGVGVAVEVEFLVSDDQQHWWSGISFIGAGVTFEDIVVPVP